MSDLPTVTTRFPLSPRAQEILELAGEAAERYGYEEIHAAHLLLGIMEEHESVAWGVLASLVPEGRIEAALDHMLRTINDPIHQALGAEIEAAEREGRDLRWPPLRLVDESA